MELLVSPPEAGLARAARKMLPTGPHGGRAGAEAPIKEDIEYSSLSDHTPASLDGPFILGLGLGLSKERSNRT